MTSFESDRLDRRAKEAVEHATLIISVGRLRWASGFFISSRYALTAAHNLLKEPRPPNPLRAEFCGIEMYVTWRKDWISEQCDAAVLEVVGALPGSAHPLKVAVLQECSVRQREDFWRAQPVIVAGGTYRADSEYIRKGPLLQALRGTVHRDTPIVQWRPVAGEGLDVTLQGLKLQATEIEFEGFSGGPVYDVERERVIALCSHQFKDQPYELGTELGALYEKLGSIADFAKCFDVWSLTTPRSCRVRALIPPARTVDVSAALTARDAPTGIVDPNIPLLADQAQSAIDLLAHIGRSWPGHVGRLFEECWTHWKLNSARFTITPPPATQQPAVLAAMLVAYTVRFLRDNLASRFGVSIAIPETPFVLAGGIDVDGPHLISAKLDWVSIAEANLKGTLLVTRNQDEECRTADACYEGFHIIPLDAPRDIFDEIFKFFNTYLLEGDWVHETEAWFRSRIQVFVDLEQKIRTAELRAVDAQKRVNVAEQEIAISDLQRERLQYWSKQAETLQGHGQELPSEDTIAQEIGDIEIDAKEQRFRKEMAEKGLEFDISPPPQTQGEMSEAENVQALFRVVLKRLHPDYGNDAPDGWWDVLMNYRWDLDILRAFEGAVAAASANPAESAVEALNHQLDRLAYLQDSREKIETRISQRRNELASYDSGQGITLDEVDLAIRAAKASLESEWRKLKRAMRVSRTVERNSAHVE